MLRVAWQGNLYQLSAVQGLKGNPPSETPANFKERCPGEKGVPMQHGPRTAKSALQLLHALHEVAVLGQAGNRAHRASPEGKGYATSLHLPGPSGRPQQAQHREPAQGYQALGTSVTARTGFLINLFIFFREKCIQLPGR